MGVDLDYGLQLGQAIRAVASLHADTSRLMLDCDKYIGKGRRSLFGNWVTRDLTYHVKADCWMPEGVFRYYEAGPVLVDAVAVTFFMSKGDPETVLQPIFNVGRIQYTVPKAAKEPDLKDLCNGWDLWWLFFKMNEKVKLGEVLECENADSGRIAWARYIGVPLVSISSIEEAVRLAQAIAPCE